MALIKCEECGKEISDKAKCCIHCGCPILTTNSINNTKDWQEVVVQQSAKEVYDKSSNRLYIEFDAAVSNKSKESTPNIVYVQELDKNVELLVPNNIKKNEKIWKKIDGDGKSNIIVFTVKSVSVNSNLSSVSTKKETKKSVKANKTAYEHAKDYNPNALVRFFDGAGVRTVISLLVTYTAIYYFKEKELMVVVICGAIALVLALIGLVYPFLNIIGYMKRKKIDKAIKNDPNYLNIAIAIYNLFPTKRLLWYIKKLNIAAGSEIERQIGKK